MMHVAWTKKEQVHKNFHLAHEENDNDLAVIDGHSVYY